MDAIETKKAVYVAVMWTDEREYRTPCRSAEEAQRLVDNYEGRGYMGWVALEEE